jgi:hypothetical protein
MTAWAFLGQSLLDAVAQVHLSQLHTSWPSHTIGLSRAAMRLPGTRELQPKDDPVPREVIRK